MKKILIWGTGKIAKQIINELVNCEVIGFVETKVQTNLFMNKRVYSIDDIPVEYDCLLIANSFADSIYNISLKKRIDFRKICFVRKPSKASIDIQHNLKIAKEIMNESLYSQICYEFGIIEEDWIGQDAIKYSSMNTKDSMKINDDYNYYIYEDKYKVAGTINSYFWQDLWAARKIYENKPETHYDIGSRVDGFISHLLTFRDNIHLIDIRPLDRPVQGIKFTRADATNLEGIADNSIESLSALCSLEHFGLGRYGDEIDPDACYKCFEAIGKKVRNGGNIYIAVPIGWEHIEFNAHRVFYASTIVEAFSCCDLLEYSCTYDGYIEYDVELHKYDNERTCGGTRFGLFHFQKKIRTD